LPPLFFFFSILILFSFPVTYGETIRAYLLDSGQAGGNGDDEIIVENNEPVDLTNNVVTIVEEIQTIGGIDVALTQEVEFVATGGDVVTLINTELPSVTVEIPSYALLKGDATWNKQLTPPKEIATSGTVAAGFQTPTTSIQVGSPDVILVFSKAVTIILQDTTGQTAYKTPDSNTWILISGCTGTFTNPDDPPVNGECSISDGTDTKILTFHFTEFAGLTETVVVETVTTTTTTSSSGGSGRTGVGPSGGSSARGSGAMFGLEPLPSDVQLSPSWFQVYVVNWWVNDSISNQEFQNVVSYLLDEKIIKIDVTEKPDILLMDLAPSIKHLFGL